MAGEILSLLITLNLVGSAAILLVLAVRRPLRRLLGPTAAYLLWLAVPLTAAAAFIPGVPNIVTLPAPAAATAPAAAAPAVPSPVLSQAAGVSPAPADPSGWALALWLAGALGAAGLILSRQKRALILLGRLSHRAGDPPGLYRTAGADGPAVVGALRPRIIVPDDFEARFGENERQVILAHETEHLLRGDVAANAVCAAIACLNWFNPLVHVALFAIRVDQELACDAAVVARYPDMRRLYGAALLKTQLAGVSLPLGCYWPGRSSWLIHERLTMLSLASPGRGRRITGAGVVGVLVVSAAVSAWASQPRPTIYVRPPQIVAMPAVESGGGALSINLVRGHSTRDVVLGQIQTELAPASKPKVAKPAAKPSVSPEQAQGGGVLECPILPAGSPPAQAVIEAVKCRLDNPTPGRSVKTIDLGEVGRTVVLLDEGVTSPDLARRAYMTQPGETAVQTFLQGYGRDPETGFLVPSRP